MDWLRVAITCEGLGATLLLTMASPTAPVADTALLDHRWNLVMKDMPALNRTVESLRTNRIASELGTLVGLHQEAATDRQMQRRLKERKSPSEHFGEGDREGHATLWSRYRRGLAGDMGGAS